MLPSLCRTIILLRHRVWGQARGSSSFVVIYDGLLPFSSQLPDICIAIIPSIVTRLIFEAALSYEIIFSYHFSQKSAIFSLNLRLGEKILCV